MRTIASRAAISPAFVRCASTAPRVLLTGGLGQVGTNLTMVMRLKYGKDNVILTDIHKTGPELRKEGPFHFLNVLDANGLEKLCVDYEIDTVIHLSAIMSVLGEAQPMKALELNVEGTRNVFEVCKNHKLKLFIPSSMAVFGPDCGKVMTKDDTILNPTTLYGITKVFAEQLGTYYHNKFGLDFRCLRYPGIISAETLPGGGTTDYAVHMYHHALKKIPYVCPVLGKEQLPMMYIDDCINGSIKFLEAPREKLNRCVYNFAGISFAPDDVLKSITKCGLKLDLKYEKGIAQDIANSWPDSMDDTNAQKDWGWKPEFDIDAISKEMLELIPQYHTI